MSSNELDIERRKLIIALKRVHKDKIDQASNIISTLLNDDLLVKITYSEKVKPLSKASEINVGKEIHSA